MDKLMERLHKRFASIGASVVGTVLGLTRRHRHEAELRRLNRTLTVISECNHVLVHATEEGELNERLCRLIVEHGGHPLAWVGFLDRGVLRPAAVAGDVSGFVDRLGIVVEGPGASPGPSATALREARAVACADIARDPIFAQRREAALAQGFRSMVCLPLRVQGQPIGVLSLYAREAGCFDAQEVALLSELADDLGYGISALRASAEMRGVLDASMAGIAVVRERRIVRCNPAMASMLGYEVAALCGLSTRELHADEVNWQAAGAEYEVLAREGFCCGERPLRRRDGSVLWCRYSLSLVDRAEPSKGVVWVAEDVTEQRAAAAALERQRRLDRMVEALAIIANEARRPLEALQACLEQVRAYLGWPLAHLVVCAQALGRNSAGASHWIGAGAPRFTPLVEASACLSDGSDPGGFLGPMLAARRPCWVTDLKAHPAFSRRLAFADGGLASALAFPVVADDEVVAYLELFSTEPVAADTLLLERIGVVAEQMARIVERARAWEAVQLRQQALEASTSAIVITDARSPGAPVVYANRAFERLTGIVAADAAGRTLHTLIGAAPVPAGTGIVSASSPPHLAGQRTVRGRRRDGTVFWCDLSLAPVADESGAIAWQVGVIDDVTEYKRYQTELEHQATHDALTGLANRSLLADRLEQALVYARRSGRPLAVLLLDLDRFKHVNDTLGHSTGDALVRAIGARLTAAVRDGDTVARLGGDEFVVVLTGLARADDVAAVAHKLLRAAAAPVEVNGRELRASASIGVALFPQDAADAESLLAHADAAMYAAKEQGGACFRYFVPELNRRAVRRLALEAGLRRALERGELRLHYQPQTDIAGTFIGVEALLRWQHPDLGLVPPADFIPLAEETGLIEPIGDWVLRTACRDVQAWEAAGLPALNVAVNISPRQFRSGDLAVRLRAILAERGFDPGRLELELTESAVMHDAAAAARVLAEVKALGVRIALDDFGTGYSSLAALKRFPIDTLKIDRSFVADLPGDAEDAAITGTVIAMGHALGLAVLAEGVETQAQLDFLCRAGCDALQGYLLARPLPPAELAGLLARGEPLVSCADRCVA